MSKLRDETSADQIINDYKKKLNSFKQFTVLNAKSDVHVVDPIREKIEYNFSLIRADFEDAIHALETRFLFQYKQYQECKRLTESEKASLELTYNLKSTVETLKKLESKVKDLENEFQVEHDRLQRLYQFKQSELSSRLSKEKQEFDNEIFEKRKNYELEIDDYENKIKLIKIELNELNHSFDLEVKEKRIECDRQIDLLQASFETQKNHLEKKIIKEKNDYKRKCEDYKFKEEQLHIEFRQKEDEFKLLISDFDKRSYDLEEKLKERSLEFETELENQRKEMIKTYIKERDTEVDRHFRSVENELNNYILDLKEKLGKATERYKKDKVLFDEKIEKYKNEKSLLESKLNESLNNNENQLFEFSKKETSFFDLLNKMEQQIKSKNEEISRLKNYSQLIKEKASSIGSEVHKLDLEKRKQYLNQLKRYYESKFLDQETLIESLNNQIKVLNSKSSVSSISSASSRKVTELKVEPKVLRVQKETFA